MTHDWSIQEIAKLAGTTSRTLRHYGDIGLLPPSRTGANGYRYYDADALTSLQRILLLRDLGLGLPAIASVLAGQADNAAALVAHRGWLENEKTRIERQIASVETTIRSLKDGTQLMADEMFDGFDHTSYKDEVIDRWGESAYADSAAWWEAGQQAFAAESAALADAWTRAPHVDPASDEAQTLAARQYAWLRQIPGTPGYPTGPTREYYLGLAELYVADERFAANYGGHDGATFVRDAMTAWAERSL